VPRGLPALVKAIRIGDKARGAGFDWDQPQDVWGKIKEELGEFESAQKSGNQEEIESELGDVLFSIVNFARLSNLDPELALERTNKKFIYRFTYMEKKAQSKGKSLNAMTLPEMELLWNEAKSKSKINSVKFNLNLCKSIDFRFTKPTEIAYFTVMKTLYLVRHAKSSWAIEDIADKDRPFEGSRYSRCTFISTYLIETMSRAKIQLCSSSAARALTYGLDFCSKLQHSCRK
jgi:NTP pyrophosphatase (non-canonical NTP hydrolase)